MKIHRNLLLTALLFAVLFVSIGCDEAEDLIEDQMADALGVEEVDIQCDEGYPEVEAPDKWTCVIALKLDEDQAKALDQNFEVDLGQFADMIGDPKFMIAFARNANVEGQNRLEFANKLVYKDEALKLDGEALEKLGDSVGSSGAGWYGTYFAEEESGFVHGVVEDCNQTKKEGILILASDGPFFNYSAGDGSWAIPSLQGKPANVNFQDGEDCNGSTSDPVTDEPNPKSDDPADTPDNDEFGDGTDNIDSGDDSMGDTPDTPAEDPPAGERFGFEDGLLGAFMCTSGIGMDCAGVSDELYGDMFPGGDETKYLYMTSGGSQNPGCTCSATFTVPADMTEIAISYDFLSQEWEEWANSPYNDMFTAIIQGEFDYVINRTVDNTALGDDWDNVSYEMSYITASDDAAMNGTSESPHSTGPYKFDGHLRWETASSETPRGGVEENSVGAVATYPVEAGSTVTLILTVSDVGDKIYDSATVIDWVQFQ